MIACYPVLDDSIVFQVHPAAITDLVAEHPYRTMLNRVSDGALAQHTTRAGRAHDDIYLRAAPHLRSTNGGDLQSGGSGSTSPSPSLNEIMLAGASSGRGDAFGGELNIAVRSVAGTRGHFGSLTVFHDRTGGGFHAIDIDPPRQGNQVSTRSSFPNLHPY
jgi:hypothetical protein